MHCCAWPIKLFYTVSGNDEVLQDAFFPAQTEISQIL